MTQVKLPKSGLAWIVPVSLNGRRFPQGQLGRSPYLADYGAVIHSSKFRRLSFKTQVQLAPSKDFVRTRLTHSLEVSQIGRQLARFLATLLSGRSHTRYKRVAGRELGLDLEDLIASACLAHDIGQAPFGHKGEKVLNTLAAGYGSRFEANKQNIRILLGTHGCGEAVAVTAQLVDAVMKYKDDRIFGDKAPAYFPAELVTAETILFDYSKTENCRHPASFLMEAADDIAYIAGDVEDFLKLRPERGMELLPLLKKLPILSRDYQVKSGVDWERLLRIAIDGDPGQISHKIIKCLLVHVCRGMKRACAGLDAEDLVVALHEFFEKKSHSKQKFNFVYWRDPKSLGEDLAVAKSKVYGDLILDSEVREKEMLAERILIELWHYFSPLFLRSSESVTDGAKEVPPEQLRRLKTISAVQPLSEDNERVRLLCDFIGGMTDRYALDLWERVCSPMRIRKIG